MKQRVRNVMKARDCDILSLDKKKILKQQQLTKNSNRMLAQLLNFAKKHIRKIIIKKPANFSTNKDKDQNLREESN